ncbi:MAG: cytochrome b/b6 domain-containing protein [Thiogranum sp.]
MNSHHIQRTLVWSGWMRLAHWLIALSVIALMATGWLVKLAPSVANSASDYHNLASIGLTLGLILRVWLLFFGPGPAHWKALVPVPADIHKMGMMLRFYLTVGKAPQPKWYAHNPLWAPLYLLVLIILLVQALTGLLMETHPLIWGFYLPSVHGLLATVTLIFACLHVITVVLHDAKGTTADVSAMINGYRIFIVDDADTMQSQEIQTISMEQIRKPR